MEWWYRYSFWADEKQREHRFIGAALTFFTVVGLTQAPQPYGPALFFALMVLLLLVPVGNWVDRRAQRRRIA